MGNLLFPGERAKGLPRTSLPKYRSSQCDSEQGAPITQALCLQKPVPRSEGDERKSDGVQLKLLRATKWLQRNTCHFISCRTCGSIFYPSWLKSPKRQLLFSNLCLPATTSSELSTVVQIHSFQKTRGYVCKLCKNQWTESVNGSTRCRKFGTFLRPPFQMFLVPTFFTNWTTTTEKGSK